MLWGNEIRYGGPGRKAAYFITIGDVELILDEDGEVTEIVVYNVDKHVEKDVLEQIAYKQLPYPRPKKPVKKPA